MAQWFYRRDNLLVASQSNHGTTVYGEAATVGTDEMSSWWPVVEKMAIRC